VLICLNILINIISNIAYEIFIPISCIVDTIFMLIMDRYQKIKLLGEGSFGKAFLVRDKTSNKQYVVKVSIDRKL